MSCFLSLVPEMGVDGESGQLGNVINGPGPIVSDDEDDLPINQTLAAGPRMSMLNPMMGMGGPMSMNMGPLGFSSSLPGSWPGMGMNGWPSQQMPQNPQLLSPAQFMPALPPDPSMIAAHQQAMMIAKQAYQMAVAQQAAMAAGDEWERSSNVGGMSTGGSVYGGGGGGPSMMGSPYGMMGMGMPGMAMPGNGWSTGSVIFPDTSRSVYGGMSGARSEYGGGGRGGGQWSSSKSSYGESFGPSNRHSKMRESGYFPPVPPIPQGKSGGHSQASSPRSRTTSQPASSPRGGVRRPPPPSSWKAGV
jgi:serine/arginine repetitive matrix protein 2